MRRSLVRNKGIDRRSFLVGAGASLFMTVLAGRMYYLQVEKGGEYRALSDDNRMRLQPVLPIRGRIIDCNNHVLVENANYYRAVTSPIRNKEAAAILIDDLAKLLGFSDAEKQELTKQMSHARQGEVVILDNNLSWKEVSLLQERAPDFPDVTVENMLLRSYPYKAIFSHVIGHVGAPSEEDIKEMPFMRYPGFKVGKNGLEQKYEKTLRGSPGFKRMEVNARGIKIRELSIEKSIPGDDLKLTIDHRLQGYAVQELSGKGGVEKEGGSAVLIDLKTAGILAMASVPGFDPNLFVTGIKPAEWKALIDNPDKPLSNKAISMQYPPGSTFKVIVALAALEAGVIDPSSTVHCPGFLLHGNRRYHCWKKEGHGTVNVVDALAGSCNVFFYRTAQKLGIERIADMARRMGLGAESGIGLPNEKTGLVPDMAWKRKAMKQDWYPGETLNAGIGQGYLLATPVQMAVAVSRLVTGKKLVPHLVMEGQHAQADLTNIDDFEDLGVSQDNIDIVMEGVIKAVNSPTGASYFTRILTPKYAMGGKTGTAQVRSRLAGGAEPTDRRHKFHSWFIGFAPIYAPRYAVAVAVEHGGYGASNAAPVGAKLLVQAQKIEAGEII